MNPMLLILLFTLLPIAGNAQNTFQKYYGDSLHSPSGWVVQQNSDSTFNIFGLENYGDVTVLQLDSTGSLLSSFTIVNSLQTIFSKAFKTDDNGYILTGNTTAGVGQYDVMLYKTDSTGNLLWMKSIGGIANEDGRDVKPTADGGYILGGFASNVTAGSYDMFLIKTDSSGNFNWSKSFGTANHEACRSVLQTKDGGYMLAGGMAPVSGPYGDFYLVKTDASGNLEWSKTYGDSVNNEVLFSALQTADTGYILAGTVNDFTPMVTKVDSLGNLEWTYKYESSAQQQIWSISECGDNGYILCGNSGISPTERAMLIKINEFGTPLWANEYGDVTITRGFFATQVFDGGYMATGAYFDSNNSPNLYVFKSDSTGYSGCYQTGFTPIAQIIPFQVNIPPTQNAQSYLHSTLTANSTVAHWNSEFEVCDTLLGQYSYEPGLFAEIYPNPAATQCTISYSISKSQDVILKLSDISGRILKWIPKTRHEAGIHNYQFNIEYLEPGTYFIELHSETTFSSSKLIKY
jgi:hypothetical protein